MNPNDKAYEAARAAILKAMAERNCIIAGVPFNENNTDEFDAGEAVEHAKVALDAAYAAHFKSEEYAGLLKDLRTPHGRCIDMRHDAADALEAVLAERDALKAANNELREENELVGKQMDRFADQIEALENERDALAARLAPVEDDFRRLTADEQKVFHSALRRSAKIKKPVEDDKLVEIAAISDADFDGRPFAGFGRADKERYLLRARATSAAQGARVSMARHRKRSEGWDNNFCLGRKLKPRNSRGVLYK